MSSPPNIDAAEFAEKLTLSTQAARIALGKMVEKDDPGIVPVGVILRAWITQTHNKFYAIACHKILGLA